MRPLTPGVLLVLFARTQPLTSLHCMCERSNGLVGTNWWGAASHQQWIFCVVIQEPSLIWARSIVRSEPSMIRATSFTDARCDEGIVSYRVFQIRTDGDSAASWVLPKCFSSLTSVDAKDCKEPYKRLASESYNLTSTGKNLQVHPPFQHSYCKVWIRGHLLLIGPTGVGFQRKRELRDYDRTFLISSGRSRVTAMWAGTEDYNLGQPLSYRPPYMRSATAVYHSWQLVRVFLPPRQNRFLGAQPPAYELYIAPVLRPQLLGRVTRYTTGMILGFCPANERRCYFGTTSLTGWAQA